MTQIVCLLGSPRVDGNSDLFAGAFLDVAAQPEVIMQAAKPAGELPQ